MARAKKAEDKPKEGATLSIDVDSFVRTRDSVSPHLTIFFPPHLSWRMRRIFNLVFDEERYRHHDHRTSPPHLNNKASDKLNHLGSRIPQPTRLYPELVRHGDLKVELRCAYVPTLFTFFASGTWHLRANPRSLTETLYMYPTTY